MSKITLFLIDNEVIIEERTDLTIEKIEEMKQMVATECSCNCEDVEVAFIDNELSDIDVTTDGMFDWKDCEARIITGVRLNLVEGSDMFLDAINNNTLADYLVFN